MENLEPNMDNAQEMSNDQNQDNQPQEYGFFGAENEDSIYTGDSDDEIINEDEQQLEGQENNDQENNDQSDNNLFNSFKSWSQEKGFEIDESNYDIENFSKEDVEKNVEKLYAERYLSNIDPTLKYLVENKMSFQEYDENQKLIDQRLSLPKENLIKSAIYNDMFNRAKGDPYSPIKPDKNGALSKEHTQALVKNVDDYYSKLSEKQIDQLHSKYVDDLKQQKNSLPKYVEEQRAAQMQEYSKEYQNSVNEFLEATRESISKQNNFISKFSAQSEKDEFIEHAKEMLSIKEVDGANVVPLIHKLETNDQFMLRVLRLIQLDDQGYFSDIKNKQRNDAFNQLNLTPNTGISSRNGKPQQTYGFFGQE